MIYYENKKNFCRDVLAEVRERKFELVSVRSQGVVTARVAGHVFSSLSAESALLQLCMSLAQAWNLGIEFNPGKVREVKVKPDERTYPQEGFKTPKVEKMKTEFGDVHFGTMPTFNKAHYEAKWSDKDLKETSFNFKEFMRQAGWDV